VPEVKQVDLKQVTEDLADRIGETARDIMDSDVADRAKELTSDVADRLGRAAKELGTGAAKAARELSSTAQDSVEKKVPKKRGISGWAIVAGGIAGALIAYLFDPQHGKTRRAVLSDWTAARVRRLTKSAAQLGRYASNTAGAMPQRVVSIQSGMRKPTPDDITLKDRVESEVFRDPDVPKGKINFDVESGIVTIRGEVDNAFRIATIEKAVFNVPGVAGVENLLHVGGTPAPNKAEARETGS
jgi:osmotically-inducible protein OsmY